MISSLSVDLDAPGRAQRDAVLARSTDVLMFFEPDGTIAWASPAIITLFGMTPDQLVGQNSFELIHPDDLDHTLEQFDDIAAPGAHVRVEFRVTDTEGKIRWIEETVTNLLEDPNVGYVVGNMRDITLQKRDEDAIRLQTRLLDAAGQAIVAYDLSRKVIYWNAAATTIYGWTTAEATGRHVNDVVRAASGWDDTGRAIGASVAAGESWSGDFSISRPDGVEIPILLADTPVFDEAGARIGTILVSSDISERKRLEADLWQLATHDQLTGLPNRTLLVSELGAALSVADGGELGVLLLDLDRFKLINDSLGHNRGDDLLAAVAAALAGLLVDGETLARFGGDTFAVVIPARSGPDQLLAVAERIRERLSAGVIVGNERYAPTISAGLVVATAGDDPTTVLRDADTAMYRAKDRGRDRIEWFDPSLHQDAVTSFELERELRQAIMNGDLHLAFQPVLDLSIGMISSCEALVRWHHPIRGDLTPDQFIPIAEATGLIVPLGAWVLREALMTAKGWPQEVSIAVNLSPRQLAEPALFDLVSGTLTELDVHPSRLVLEITENAVLHDPTAAALTIGALRELGVRVVIDDFGTGYTSLAFLRDYRIDGLKIDRSFVTGLDHGSTAIVDAMIRMSGALDLTVIAEGIETEVQLDQLRDLGCGYIQGYLISKPVASVDLPFMQPDARPRLALTNTPVPD